jgi:hypothetical protein
MYNGCVQIADPKQFDAVLFVLDANIHAGSVALNLRTESSQMLFATHPATRTVGQPSQIQLSDVSPSVRPRRLRLQGPSAGPGMLAIDAGTIGRP